MEPVVSMQKTTSIIPAANPDSINLETYLVGFFLAATATALFLAGTSFLGEATTGAATVFLATGAFLGGAATLGEGAFLATTFFSAGLATTAAFLSLLAEALALVAGAVLALETLVGVAGLGLSFLVSLAIFLVLLGFFWTKVALALFYNSLFSS